ncbi:MAG: sugar phosphate nucleotidyltransferase [Acidobacteriota bacterium]
MKAVILAGGLGNRLKPFTETIPKPLLPIGEKSVLEIQIQNLARYGFDEIYIATYYKSDYVESFIGDGKKLGVRVRFSKEKIPLGTCGPLSLLKEELTEPFILMNGDILSNINLEKLYSFAKEKKSDLTVVTKIIKAPFQFGKVMSKDDYIVDVIEKPDLELEILAGIYVMKPDIFRWIPEGTYFGIDQLIKKMLAQSTPVAKYLMSEYWLDIGMLEDYSEAQVAYEKHFKEPS